MSGDARFILLTMTLWLALNHAVPESLGPLSSFQGLSLARQSQVFGGNHEFLLL
jgi:hypothetical protein